MRGKPLLDLRANFEVQVMRRLGQAIMHMRAPISTSRKLTKGAVQFLAGTRIDDMEHDPMHRGVQALPQGIEYGIDPEATNADEHTIHRTTLHQRAIDDVMRTSGAVRSPTRRYCRVLMSIPRRRISVSQSIVASEP